MELISIAEIQVNLSTQPVFFLFSFSAPANAVWFRRLIPYPSPIHDSLVSFIGISNPLLYLFSSFVRFAFIKHDGCFGKTFGIGNAIKVVLATTKSAITFGKCIFFVYKMIKLMERCRRQLRIQFLLNILLCVKQGSPRVLLLLPVRRVCRKVLHPMHP